MPSLALFRPSLLAAAIAVAPLPLLAQSASDSAATVDNVREYALPAAPLATTLNRIAAEAGLVLSIDPGLTRERMAQPVQGRFDSQSALREALRGTGLELRQSNSGSYSVQPAPTDAMALPDVTVTASAQDIDGSEAIGYRSDRAKNVGALGNLPLLNTPYSLSVVSHDMLQNTQTTSSDDVFKRNPFTQLYSPKNAGYASAVSIRGFSGAGNLSIANDGLRFSTGYDSGNFIEEMEQLEVLTGLSGFLYGPGSPGGLVNYVLKRPTAERYNSVTLGNAGGENYYLHGDFGGPLDSEGKFGYRVNVLTQDGETAIDLQKRRRQMISAALDWNVSETLLIQFDASHKKSETRGLNSYWYIPEGSMRPNAGDLDNDKLYSQRWAFSDSEHDRVGTRFNWQLNDVLSLRGALAYSEYTNEYAYTGPSIYSPGTYTQELYAFAPVDTEETAGYLFLDSVFDTASVAHKMTVGYQGSVARVKNYEDYIPYPGPQYQSVVGTIPLDEQPQVAKPAYSVGNGDQRVASRTQSDNLLIGDVVTFNDRWSTILGVTRTRIKTYNNDFVWAEAFGYAETASYYDETKTSPNISLVYKPAPWISTYITYIEGLEEGGIAPSTAINAGQAVAPEVSEQYEVGIKALVGETLLTLAVFDIDKPNSFTDSATNVYMQDGRQQSQGIEFGITGRVLPQLTLVGGITLLDPEVKESGVAANNGNKPTNVASRLAKVYAEYDVAALPGFALTGGAYYTGKQYSDEANEYSLPSFTTVDAGARYRMHLNEDTAVTWRANVSNLGDKHYWLNSHYLGDPRTLTFSGQLEF